MHATEMSIPYMARRLAKIGRMIASSVSIDINKPSLDRYMYTTPVVQSQREKSSAHDEVKLG
jgi:hypothetical protein